MRKNKYGTEKDIIRLFSFRSPQKIIQAIKNSGGIPVLAHPACYWAINLDKYIKSLIDMGLEGIETYYPYKRHRKIIKFHSKKTVLKIADKYQLLKTGGTDSHNDIID